VLLSKYRLVHASFPMSAGAPCFTFDSRRTAPRWNGCGLVSCDGLDYIVASQPLFLHPPLSLSLSVSLFRTFYPSRDAGSRGPTLFLAAFEMLSRASRAGSERETRAMPDTFA